MLWDLLLSWGSPFYFKIIWFNMDTMAFTALTKAIRGWQAIFDILIIALPAVQPVDKRWSDAEVVIKVGY